MQPCKWFDRCGWFQVGLTFWKKWKSSHSQGRQFHRGVLRKQGNENHAYFHEIYLLINSFPPIFVRNLRCLCPGPTLLVMDTPNSRVSHGLNGSTNRDGSHGSWVCTTLPAQHSARTAIVKRPVTHWPMINMHPETVEAISIVLEGLKTR